MFNKILSFYIKEIISIYIIYFLVLYNNAHTHAHEKDIFIFYKTNFY